MIIETYEKVGIADLWYIPVFSYRLRKMKNRHGLVTAFRNNGIKKYVVKQLDLGKYVRG